MNFVVATLVGNQTLSPPMDALRMQSPGARNLIILPSTEQTDGVVEVTSGGIVKPRVGDFDET